MRLAIVFEETKPEAGGIGFNVFIDGLTPARRKTIDMMTPEEQLKELSTAEFWTLRAFQIVMATMIRAGTVQSVKALERD